MNRARKTKLFGVALVFSVLAVVVFAMSYNVATTKWPVIQPVFASGATVVTYSDFGCTTPASTFMTGTQTVHAGGTFSGGTPYSVQYSNPSGTVVRTYSGLTASTYCDATGYPLPSNAPTGTWNIQVLDKNGHSLASTNFTVSQAIPDLPFGAMPIFLAVVILTLSLRRWHSVSPSASASG